MTTLVVTGKAAQMMWLYGETDEDEQPSPSTRLPKGGSTGKRVSKAREVVGKTRTPKAEEMEVEKS